MKEIDSLTKLSFYLAWVFSGIVSFSLSIVLTLLVPIMGNIFGDTIVVDGQTRITEDYIWAYAFIPWFGIIIGLIQYLLLNLRIPITRWWILTTTICWSFVFLGLGFYYSPVDKFRIPQSVLYLVLAGVILGLLIGIVQWVILRVYLSHTAWWVPVNVIGFGLAGFILGDISSLYEAFFAFTIPLITIGALLWLLFDAYPQGKDYGEKTLA